jgi:HEAT repeat protein
VVQGALALLFVLALSSRSVAQDKVGPYAEELHNNPDFRVRTQAALALGASADKRAVEPLCGGLEDENTTVRAASAAALGKLLLGGDQCLEHRLKDETNASVRSVIEKALERIRSGGAPSGPVLESATYYVGIGLVTNKTDRTDDELDRAVRGSLVKALGQLSGYVAAPKAETADQARSVLAKFKQLKPFFIWPKVGISYENGDLTVKFDLSLFTYPGKAFKGSMSRNLTMPDTPTRDPAAEDELIQTAAENLVPELAKLADRL